MQGIYLADWQQTVMGHLCKKFDLLMLNIYRIGKFDLPHLSPHCMKQVVVHSCRRAMEDLADKQEAILISNILRDMHTHNLKTV